MLATTTADPTAPGEGDDGDLAAGHGCPLADCAHRARSPDDLYCHLLVTHRKSDLGAALVDRDR
ncbi:MAG: hypothetical protein ABEH47_01100 [Haloferacaceae archaeon]